MFTYTVHTRSLPGDLTTPVSTYLKVRDLFAQSALVESSDYHGSENNRSFIGLSPLASFSVSHGEAIATCPDGTTSRRPLSESYTVDLPFERFLIEFRETADRYGLEVVFLVTPETPDERIWAIDDYAHSFIYAVSSAASTGAQRSFDEQKQAYFARLQSMQLSHPFLIGFGISNRATREAADAYSAGVIVGSKFDSLLEQSADPAEAVEALHRCLAS